MPRRLGSTALIVTLGLSVAACGADDTDTTSTDSTSSSDGADTGVDEAAELSELDAAAFYPNVMEALKDAETFKFSATSTSSGASSTMSGVARYTDDGMDMSAASAGPQAMEVIMLDRIVYMKSDEMGLGDKWLKIDLEKSGDSIFGMLAKSTDPEAMFKTMESPKKLELVGEEEVDGVETNHYRITVDPTAYMDAMGFPADMAQFLPKELVTDMWVDADDLPRKFSQDITTPGGGGQVESESKTEGFYTDFGTDVEIEAPAAEDVTEDMPGMPGAA